MKCILSVIITLVIITAAPSQDIQKLVYADFEQLDKDNRPISAREGKIIFDAGAQNNDKKPKLAPRLLGAQGPLTQRIDFEFEIFEPNAWAEASIKIIGLKDKGRLDDWAKTLIVR